METVAAARLCSMIVIPSIAFNEFSGSAGEVTARSVKGRTKRGSAQIYSHWTGRTMRKTTTESRRSG